MALAMKSLPTSWSNKNRLEKLRSDAADSFSRMIARAVAETNTNFQLYDALRTKAEQIELFTKYYRNTGKKYKTSSNDRYYNGTYWAWRGEVKVASPDLGSNHQTGVAVDLHPGPIQEWVKKNGRRFGWDWAEGKRNNENWHFRYYPNLDQYTSEGWLDHGAVQKAVGAEVDNKIGVGTVAKIKEFQKANGLEVDGKVGPATKKAMRLSGKAEEESNAEEPEAPPATTPPTHLEPTTKTDGGFTYTYLREDWDTQGVGSKVHPFETTVEGAYIHHPAAGDVTLANESVEDTMSRLRRYRRDHVEGHGWNDIGYLVAADQRGYLYQLRGGEMESGANGGEVSNNHGTAILCLLGDNEEPTSLMIQAVNSFLAQQKEVFPTSTFIRGHKESPDADTSCPGSKLMYRIQNGTFSYSGEPIVQPGEPIVNPSDKPSGIPTGKDLLVALINAPDFPLLRTSSHLCYYGPEEGPLESVSGKKDNSLNPGDIVNGSSEGLKKFQKRLVERGYSIAADGKYGDETANAVDNLQRLAGLTRDKKVGPDTWYAAWILPVK